MGAVAVVAIAVLSVLTFPSITMAQNGRTDSGSGGEQQQSGGLTDNGGQQSGTGSESSNGNQGESQQLGQEEDRGKRQCESATARVPAATRKYEQARQEYNNRYDGLVERVRNLANVLEGQGIDAQRLREHVAEVEQLQQQLSQQIRSAVANMNQVQTKACGSSGDEYKQSLGSARSDLSSARSTVKRINDKFVNDVATELRIIRDNN